MVSTIPVDGAMGTTLHRRGLHGAADHWVDEQPDAVARVHAEFVDAGARILRTATLCSRPDAGHPVSRLRTAVALARGAEPDEVWLSLGPLGPRRGSLEGLQAALDVGADRVLLETFVDPEELVQATSWLAERGARVVASLAALTSGPLANDPYPAHELRSAGAEVLGLNCGVHPEDAVELWRKSQDRGPWFVAPAGGPTLSASWRSLKGDVAFLGGCCGTDPEQWSLSWPS